MRRLAPALIVAALASGALAGEAGGPRRYRPDQVRSALAEILARPEYNSPLSGAVNWVEDLVMIVARLLREFLREMESLMETSPVLYWLIVAGCLALLVLLLSHIGWTLYHAVTMDRRAGGAARTAKEPSETPATLRSRADDLAARGQHVDAIRVLFRSLALELQRRRGASLFRPLTNREFAAVFRENREVFERLSQFVDVLDDRWYGMRPCEDKDYALCRTAYDKVMATARA